MIWEAIEADGEKVGAPAIVITLIYLATQVRYAKQIAADQNRLVRASGVREMALTGVTTPKLLPGSRTSLNGPQHQQLATSRTESLRINI